MSYTHTEAISSFLFSQSLECFYAKTEGTIIINFELFLLKMTEGKRRMTNEKPVPLGGSM